LYDFQDNVIYCVRWQCQVPCCGHGQSSYETQKIRFLQKYCRRHVQHITQFAQYPPGTATVVNKRVISVMFKDGCEDSLTKSDRRCTCTRLIMMSLRRRNESGRTRRRGISHITSTRRWEVLRYVARDPQAAACRPTSSPSELRPYIGFNYYNRDKLQPRGGRMRTSNVRVEMAAGWPTVWQSRSLPTNLWMNNCLQTQNECGRKTAWWESEHRQRSRAVSEHHKLV